MGVTGGIVEQEAAIDLSNLSIWNPKKKGADKIKYSEDKDGKKSSLRKDLFYKKALVLQSFFIKVINKIRLFHQNHFSCKCLFISL